MWIQTRTRAVSIVAVDDESSVHDLVQIRGRLRSDVSGLVKNAKIIRTPKADYRYRIIIPRKTLVAVLTRLASEIVYTNFKQAVWCTGDKRRYDAYACIHHLIEDGLSEGGSLGSFTRYPPQKLGKTHHEPPNRKRGK